MSIESLDQLPDVAKKPFLVLCQLAYDGIMEGKIIPPDVNTLSLLSFFVTTRSGKLYWMRQSSLPQFHSFVHTGTPGCMVYSNTVTGQ